MGSKVGRFEDLEVWKEGMRLAVALYKQLAFCKDFGLRDQLQRSAVSIPSNIAEGYDRGSNKEFIQFLHTAQASLSELDTQVIICKQLGYLSEDSLRSFDEQMERESKLIRGLIKYLKK